MGLESISSIKTLKFYQWSDKFRNLIKQSKITDMDHLRWMGFFGCIVLGAEAFLPNIVSTSCFFLSTKLGRTIDLSSVYLAMTFFDRIKGPMNGLPNSLV
jgi:hypothetical protein